jgi:hypothetical protein
MVAPGREPRPGRPLTGGPGHRAESMEYSHRDRRAHRTVGRGFFLTVAAVAALTLAALVLPGPILGVIAVGSLAATGAVALAWGDRVVTDYATDLREVRDGTIADGFVRTEVESHVGLERTIGRPSERSPHARRRRRGPETAPGYAPAGKVP